MGKILYFPMNSVGHITIALALAKQLRVKYGKQHELVLALEEKTAQEHSKWSDLMTLATYDAPIPETLKKILEENPAFEDETDIMINQMAKKWARDPLIMIKDLCPQLILLIERAKLMESSVNKLIEEVKPQFILMDTLFNIPFLMNKNIPWGVVNSANPLFSVSHPSLPFSMSGLSIKDTSKKEFLDKVKECTNEYIAHLNEYLETAGQKLPNLQFYYGSEYLNLYMYPEELDYEYPEGARQGVWYRFDCSQLPENTDQLVSPTNEITLSKEFLALPGKLIFVALGSLVTTHLPSVVKMISLLGDLPHKFIVVKGKKGGDLELPANCVGGKFLNQLEVLKIVDGMISHGGNNSFTECAANGVPMAIIPFFGDQPDNAQRLVDLNMGVRLNFQTLTKEDLLKAIDTITQPEIVKKWKDMSAKITKRNTLEKCVDTIVEKFLK